MLFDKSALKKLILPLIIEQVLALTVGMADVMMVSSVGEAAISGVSLVDMINNLLIAIFAALATGGAVITAQYIGAKDFSRATESSKQVLIIALVISLGIMSLCLVFKHFILSLLFGKITNTVMSNALTYFYISALSYPFLAVYNASAALFRAMGNSKISMKISVIMNIINISGNAFCIYILKLDIAGVAIPSLISRIFACIVMFSLLYSSKNIIHFSNFRFIPNWQMIKKILYIGIPSGIESGIFQLGRVLVVSIIAGFGTVQIAANAVANSIDGLGCIAGQAMSLAMITVIGQCVGANDEKQVVYYTKRLTKITYIITFIINSTILLTLPLILNIFELSADTRKLAYILIFLHNGFAMLLWPSAFTLPNALRACNDVKYPMVMSIFSMFAFRIVLSLIIGVYFGLGAIGVWIAMIVDWIFRAGAFIIRFYKTHPHILQS